jgi:hypothetical protein
MCSVSNISDHYGQTVPFQQPYIPFPLSAPATLPWTEDSLKLLKEVLEKVKELDKKLGLANCEDPKKQEWMADIEQRVKKLEKKKTK